MSSYYEGHADCCELQSLNGTHCTCGFEAGLAFLDAIGVRVNFDDRNRVRMASINTNVARTVAQPYTAIDHADACDVKIYGLEGSECDCGFSRGLAYLDRHGNRVHFDADDRYQTVPLSALEDAKKPLAVKPAQPEQPKRRMSLRKPVPPPKPEPKVTEAKRPPALPNRPFVASDFLTQPMINPAEFRPPGRAIDIRTEMRPWRENIIPPTSELEMWPGQRTEDTRIRYREIVRQVITITGEGDFISILEDALRQAREHEQR